MCAAYDGPELDEATYAKQLEALCLVRWEVFFYGICWLKFLRRRWGLTGQHLQGQPKHRLRKARAYFGAFGPVLREIRALGKAAEEEASARARAQAAPTPLGTRD